VNNTQCKVSAVETHERIYLWEKCTLICTKLLTTYLHYNTKSLQY